MYTNHLNKTYRNFNIQYTNVEKKKKKKKSTEKLKSEIHTDLRWKRVEQ